MYTLLCFIHDGNPASSFQPFPVKIEEDEIVAVLKTYIHQQKSNLLKDFDADQVTLYKIKAYGDTPETRSESLQEEILRVDELRKFSKSALDVCDLISDVFPDGPPRKTYHILVVLPQGEPIASSDPTHAREERVASGEREAVWTANRAPDPSPSRLSLACGQYPLMGTRDVPSPSFLCSGPLTCPRHSPSIIHLSTPMSVL